MGTVHLSLDEQLLTDPVEITMVDEEVGNLTVHARLRDAPSARLEVRSVHASCAAGALILSMPPRHTNKNLGPIYPTQLIVFPHFLLV